MDDFVVVRSVAIMAVARSCSRFPAQDLALERKYIHDAAFSLGFNLKTKQVFCFHKGADDFVSLTTGFGKSLYLFYCPKCLTFFVGLRIDLNLSINSTDGNSSSCNYFSRYFGCTCE